MIIKVLGRSALNFAPARRWIRAESSYTIPFPRLLTMLQRQVAVSSTLVACSFFILLVSFAPPATALPAEGVTPVNNREYGNAVRELIQKSKKSLAIMLYQARFYPEYPDTLTNYLVHDLIAAKQRGVDVKIVVDTGDWNPQQKNEYNTDFVDRLTTSGIEIWEDSPEEVSHQKVICIDDDITVVSSNNWLYYSIAKNNEVAVVIYSPQVNQWFRDYFAERVKGGTPRANVSATGPDPGFLASDMPGLKGSDLADLRKYPVTDVQPIPNRQFYPAVHDLLLSASQSIDVVQHSIDLRTSYRLASGQTPLPGQPQSLVNVLVEDLISAKKRGVKVRVVLEKFEDRPSESTDVTARLLMDNGIEVYQDDLTVTTHAKLVVVDDDKVVVGSTNWTSNAVENGNEASVVLVSPEVNKVYKGYVETVLRTSTPYQFETRSIWDPPTRAQQDR